MRVCQLRLIAPPLPDASANGRQARQAVPPVPPQTLPGVHWSIGHGTGDAGNAPSEPDSHRRQNCSSADFDFGSDPGRSSHSGNRVRTGGGNGGRSTLVVGRQTRRCAHLRRCRDRSPAMARGQIRSRAIPGSPEGDTSSAALGRPRLGLRSGSPRVAGCRDSLEAEPRRLFVFRLRQGRSWQARTASSLRSNRSDRSIAPTRALRRTSRNSRAHLGLAGQPCSRSPQPHGRPSALGTAQ